MAKTGFLVGNRSETRSAVQNLDTTTTAIITTTIRTLFDGKFIFWYLKWIPQKCVKYVAGLQKLKRNIVITMEEYVVKVAKPSLEDFTGKNLIFHSNIVHICEIVGCHQFESKLLD